MKARQAFMFNIG